MRLAIEIPDDLYERLTTSMRIGHLGDITRACEAVIKGKRLTPDILADLLMEERIRGKLDSDTTFEKDVIDDVRCRLTVEIIDHRPYYCGAGLKEVWRESKASDANSD